MIVNSALTSVFKLMIAALIVLSGCTDDQKTTTLESESKPEDTLQMQESLSTEPIDNQGKDNEVSDHVPRSDVGQDVMITQLYIPRPLNTNIAVARIEGRQLVPEIVGVTSAQPAGFSALGASKKKGYKAVLAGGFMAALAPPTPAGLLVIEGDTISPLNPRGYSTILVVSEDRIRLVSRDSLHSEEIDGAFQVGPRLIAGGDVAIYQNEPVRHPAATRAFVGLQEDGSVLLGITENQVHLYHLANYLVGAADSVGLRCCDAVNLCGGGVEAFVVDLGDTILTFGNLSLRQASMLAFR